MEIPEIEPGTMDLNRPAVDFLLELANRLKSGSSGDSLMLTIVDEDNESVDPVFLTVYITGPEEIAEIAEQIEEAESVENLSAALPAKDRVH